MKLLFCIPLMCGGGAERVMALLCNGLSARGHEVVLATDTKQESFYSLDKKIRLVSLYPDLASGGNIFRKIYYNLFLLYPKIRTVIKKEKPDVIISFLYILNPKVILASRFLNIQVVYCEHTNFINNRTWLKTIRRVYINKLADKVTVLTQRDFDLLKGKLNNMEIMPNPISFPVCNIFNVFRKKVVLAVGNLNAYEGKGFLGLIKAWSSIASKNKDWTLCIAGRGSEKSMYILRNLIEECKLESQVKLLGEIKDIELLYRTSTIFVLSSKNEGLPMVLMEAMSQGCACVSFDISTGPREIIDDGVDGILVKENDFGELMEKIEWLISDEEMCRKLGEKAMLSMNRYSLPVILDKWESLLSGVRNEN